jgi:serine/threonine protein kinase
MSDDGDECDHPPIDLSIHMSEINGCLSERGYELLDELGRGNFAVCYRVRDRRYPTEVFCAKIIASVFTENEKSAAASYAAEVNTLISITHPNIITVYATFASQHYFYLILEYCENGSLKELLVARHGLGRDELISYCKQLLSAIGYLHERHFCHRDLKPANILIDKHGRLKLADFGLASRSTDVALKLCGSLAYMSPELIDRPSSNPEANDVWALGVTFYEMMVGKRPFESSRTSELKSIIISGFVPIPLDFNPQLAAVLRRMMNSDPRRRGTPQEIIDMPFFSGVSNARSVSAAVLPGMLPSRPGNGRWRPALPRAPSVSGHALTIGTLEHIPPKRMSMSPMPLPALHDP